MTASYAGNYAGNYAADATSTRPRVDVDAELRRIRDLAHLLDEAFRIPVVNYRFGVDAVLGLVPVLGDLTGFAFSGYLIWQAARLGAPVRLLARMVLNALLEAVVGSVPVLGSIFDVVWKANTRNLRLLEDYLSGAR